MKKLLNFLKTHAHAGNFTSSASWNKIRPEAALNYTCVQTIIKNTIVESFKFSQLTIPNISKLKLLVFSLALRDLC